MLNLVKYFIGGCLLLVVGCSEKVASENPGSASETTAKDSTIVTFSMPTYHASKIYIEEWSSLEGAYTPIDTIVVNAETSRVEYQFSKGSQVRFLLDVPTLAQSSQVVIRSQFQDSIYYSQNSLAVEDYLVVEAIAGCKLKSIAGSLVGVKLIQDQYQIKGISADQIVAVDWEESACQNLYPRLQFKEGVGEFFQPLLNVEELVSIQGKWNFGLTGDASNPVVGRGIIYHGDFVEGSKSVVLSPGAWIEMNPIQGVNADVMAEWSYAYVLNVSFKNQNPFVLLGSVEEDKNTDLSPNDRGVTPILTVDPGVGFYLGVADVGFLLEYTLQAQQEYQIIFNVDVWREIVEVWVDGLYVGGWIPDDHLVGQIQIPLGDNTVVGSNTNELTLTRVIQNDFFLVDSLLANLKL